MTKQTVDEAVDSAREFIKRASKINWRGGTSIYSVASTIETAATKRASMDLTRALARMRNV